MQVTRIMMGMPVAVGVVGAADTGLHEQVFDWFDAVDRRFSTYRQDSEIGALNRGTLSPFDCSADMREILGLAERTRRETGGYFDIQTPDGQLDPSGIVKGWAIRRAAAILAGAGVRDFFVDAGGDIQSCGRNAEGGDWSVGIRNPFAPDEIVKVVYPRGKGVATSGSYVRGRHIYDPHQPAAEAGEIVSLSVIGPDVLEADRFATAAFAMGRDGIAFVESLPGFEGYLIDRNGRATLTSGFEGYTR